MAEQRSSARCSRAQSGVSVMLDAGTKMQVINGLDNGIR